MSKKEKEKTDLDPASWLAEQGISSKDVLQEIIADLQQFCQDNILALYPLLEETEKNAFLEQRISNFIMINGLLNGVNRLVEADVSLTSRKKKSCAKKSNKKK